MEIIILFKLQINVVTTLIFFFFGSRFLNKAVLVMNNDEAENEESRICTVRQIEDIKSIISIIPIFASSIIGFLAMNQQQTFTVSQALKMDLRLPGTSYLIPPASITVISLLTIGI